MATSGDTAPWLGGAADGLRIVGGIVFFSAFTGTLVAAVFFAATFFTGIFFAGDFLAATFFAATFFAGAFFAAARLPAGFAARARALAAFDTPAFVAAFRTGLRAAADVAERLVGDFFAVFLPAAVFFDPALFFIALPRRLMTQAPRILPRRCLPE